MAIVTHATCKSKESLRHCCGIREGFTDGQGEEGKKSFRIFSLDRGSDVMLKIRWILMKRSTTF